MATPFKAILKFKTQAGSSFQIPCTVSDVNAAFYVPPEGGNSFAVPTGQGQVALTDVMLSAAGAEQLS